MAKYGVFTTGDAKRIAAATRVVESAGRSFLRVPQQISHRYGGTATEDDDDGYPPDTDSCPCDECFEGIDLPDADPETSVCCKGHTKRTIVQPWTAAPVQGELELKYIGGGLWATEPFDGPECDTAHNVYRYLMTPSATAGGSTIALELVTDNGCDVACIVFVATLPYICLCNNSFDLVKWGNVDRSAIACRVCDKPTPREPAACASCFDTIPLPLQWELDFGAGPDDDQCTGCTTIGGVYTLDTFESDSLHTSNDPAIGLWPVAPRRSIFAAIGEFTDCVVSPQYDGIKYAELICGYSGNSGIGIIVHNMSPSGGRDTLALYDGECGDDRTFATPMTLTLRDGGLGFGTTCQNWPATITLVAVSDAPSPSSDGSCAGCDTNVGIPAPSACCFEGECYEWDAGLCADFGGTMFADSDECAEECSPTGICCAGGFCIDHSSLYECGLYGGTFVGGSDCSVCDATGACCRADGSCDNDVLPGDCAGAGDHHYGSGTDCTGRDCLGACCCDNDSCCYGDSFTYDSCIDSGFGPTPQCGGGLVVPTFFIDGDCNDCADPTICV